MPIIQGSVSGPRVQYVRRHKKCPWSYGSVCTSLQGALLVIRIRMLNVRGKVLYRSYSSRFAIFTWNFPVLTVRNAYRYEVKKL